MKYFFSILILLSTLISSIFALGSHQLEDIKVGSRLTSGSYPVELLCTSRMDIPSHARHPEAGKTKLSLSIVPISGNHKGEKVGFICVSYKAPSTSLEISFLDIEKKFRRNHYAENGVRLLFKIFDEHFETYSLCVQAEGPFRAPARARYHKLGFLPQELIPCPINDFYRKMLRLRLIHPLLRKKLDELNRTHPLDLEALWEEFLTKS